MDNVIASFSGTPPTGTPADVAEAAEAVTAATAGDPLHVDDETPWGTPAPAPAVHPSEAELDRLLAVPRENLLDELGGIKPVGILPPLPCPLSVEAAELALCRALEATEAAYRTVRAAHGDPVPEDLSIWDDPAALEIEVRKAAALGVALTDAELNMSDDKSLICLPLTLLDARKGPWSSRKKEWHALGLRSEVGRDDINVATFGKAISGTKMKYDKDKQIDAKKKTLNHFDVPPEEVAGNWVDSKFKQKKQADISVFDPVLCEIGYGWYCPKGGHILDPFAGGPVRGIVSAIMGRPYTGVDLRPEQVAANEENAPAVLSKFPGAPAPRWVVGDSTKICSLAPGEYDHIYTCPPYADLEVYSSDPEDLSNMPWGKFTELYTNIITESCKMLKDNRFATYVVGNVRDRKTGAYHDLVGLTIQAFEKAGLTLYNEAVLISMFGTVQIRAKRLFQRSRKLSRTHQNVLVFVKGDGRVASDLMEWPVPPLDLGYLTDDQKAESTVGMFMLDEQDAGE